MFQIHQRAIRKKLACLIATIIHLQLHPREVASFFSVASVFCWHTRFQQPKHITRSLKQLSASRRVDMYHTYLSVFFLRDTATKENAFFVCAGVYPSIRIPFEKAAFCGRLVSTSNSRGSPFIHGTQNETVIPNEPTEIIQNPSKSIVYRASSIALLVSFSKCAKRRAKSILSKCGIILGYLNS